MKSRMPERARTDPWEPQGSNPLGPPGPELPVTAKGEHPDRRWYELRRPGGLPSRIDPAQCLSHKWVYAALR